MWQAVAPAAPAPSRRGAPCFRRGRLQIKVAGAPQPACRWGPRQPERPHRGPSWPSPEGQTLSSPGWISAGHSIGQGQRESPALSIILKETKYLIVCSRQTHSRRQISSTPRYPGAQSILIKKRFWLLHEPESWASFTARCPQREAAGTTSDVKLSSRAPAPSLPP